jgi:pimeloyl-ACP methyl ester carboxylesterase
MLLKRRYVLPLLVILAFVGFRNCRILELRMSDKELKETVASLPVPFQIVHSRVNKRSVRYIKVGYDSLPKLICLHGSPSSLSAWRTIYTDTFFLRNYQVIAIDRPGYGYSDFGWAETDLQKQVSTLQVLIDSMTVKQHAILFGSSYGGPVAAQLAMNLPERISQLVLLSASVMPGREKTYWISYPMTFPVLKYLFPPTFVMSSEEKLVHRQQLETLNHWEKIKSDVLIIHGNRDGLVYYDNAEYARKKLIKARSVKTITMNGKGHSIIFSRPDFIKRILKQYLYPNRN